MTHERLFEILIENLFKLKSALGVWLFRYLVEFYFFK